MARGCSKSGLTVTATCTSCHTAHRVLPERRLHLQRQPRNLPADLREPATHGIQEQFETQRPLRLVSKSDKPLPVCNDCHTAHTIQRTDASQASSSRS